MLEEKANAEAKFSILAIWQKAQFLAVDSLDIVKDIFLKHQLHFKWVIS
jgi:hypothetical protein